ncbi:MAG TPA: hypothetical protein VGY32_14215 [Solirubrobacteraceae bacterium]|jgi:hypothetical protein|nr:hypothetical protein [Solirubrobacteraceae bacterium]
MTAKRKAREEISGRTVQVTQPNWDALRSLVDDELADRFMWMSEVELEDGTRLNAYKDHMSRRYLHLADDRRAFYFTDDAYYHEVDPRTALMALYIDVAETARLDEVEQAALRLALAKLDRDLGEA